MTNSLDSAQEAALSYVIAAPEMLAAAAADVAGIGSSLSVANRLRGVQPPQGGADQTDATRLVELYLPAVHRAGLQDGSQAFLTSVR